MENKSAQSETTFDPVVQKIARELSDVFRRTALLAETSDVAALFDSIGLRHELVGYDTLLRAVQLYCAAPFEKLTKNTFASIVQTLGREFDGAPRWIEKQMQYVLNDAYKTGSILRLNDYSLGTPIASLEYPITVAEFLAEIRSQLSYRAMRDADQKIS